MTNRLSLVVLLLALLDLLGRDTTFGEIDITLNTTYIRVTREAYNQTRSESKDKGGKTQPKDNQRDINTGTF